MHHTIKRRDGRVIWVGEAPTMSAAVERAHDLDLTYADLSGMNLRGMALRGAELSAADFTGADLTGAVIVSSDLIMARFDRARLIDAVLNDSDCTGAVFEGADMLCAALTRTDLSLATFSNHVQLGQANLAQIKASLHALLDVVPSQVTHLLALLRAGRIDGRSYIGECRCLVGSIVQNPLGSDDAIVTPHGMYIPDPDGPLESWSYAIRPRDTPENSPLARVTADWIEQWQQFRRADGIK